MKLTQEKATALVLQYGFYNWQHPSHQLNDPQAGYYNFTTDEFAQWYKEDEGKVSPIPSLAEINIVLNTLPKCTPVVSDDNPNDLWCWRLDP
jgi:hypothetical protein